METQTISGSDATDPEVIAAVTVEDGDGDGDGDGDCEQPGCISCRIRRVHERVTHAHWCNEYLRSQLDKLSADHRALLELDAEVEWLFNRLEISRDQVDNLFRNVDSMLNNPASRVELPTAAGPVPQLEEVSAPSNNYVCFDCRLNRLDSRLNEKVAEPLLAQLREEVDQWMGLQNKLAEKDILLDAKWLAVRAQLDYVAQMLSGIDGSQSDSELLDKSATDNSDSTCSRGSRSSSESDSVDDNDGDAFTDDEPGSSFAFSSSGSFSFGEDSTQEIM